MGQGAPRASEVLQGPPTQGHVKTALKLSASTVHPKPKSSQKLLIITVNGLYCLRGGLGKNSFTLNEAEFLFLSSRQAPVLYAQKAPMFEPAFGANLTSFDGPATVLPCSSCLPPASVLHPLPQAQSTHP